MNIFPMQSVESLRRSLAGASALRVALLVCLGLLASCGGCDEEPSPPGMVADVGTDTEPDADVEPDADADVERPDADVEDEDGATIEDADADADIDEVDADVPPDVPMDADTDVDDGDAPPDEPDVIEPDALGDVFPTNFEASCIYPVISCFAGDPEPQSCTINALTDVIEVSYGDGIAARIEEGLVSGTRVTVYANGEPCFAATPLESGSMPLSWRITDLKGDGNQYTLALLDNRARVNCAGGSGEDWDRETVAPWLPDILTRQDLLCEEVLIPRCSLDADCVDQGSGLQCCETAEVTRCLSTDDCPDVPPLPAELTGCLAPVLGCFGADAVPTECVVDAIAGDTSVRFTSDRLASFHLEGPTLSIETSRGGEGCWRGTATLGLGRYEDYTIEDLVGGGTYRVSLEGEVATVTCPDTTVQTVSAAVFERFVPPALGEEDPLCDFQCASDSDCGAEKCCLVEEGYRCLNTILCPNLGNPLEGSCIGTTLSCFGDAPDLVSCIEYDFMDLTYASYRSGSQAAYYSVDGVPHLRTRYPTRECFDASLGADGWEVMDLLTGQHFQIAFAGMDAQLTCPDSSVETVPTATLSRFFPERPDPGSCMEPNRQDQCQVDAECTNAILPVCCDVGTRNLCNSVTGCDDARPRGLCDSDADCGLQGEVCCGRDQVRVCDYGLCGDTLCCRRDGQAVCEPADVCASFDRCDPMDANACGAVAGTRCCQDRFSSVYDCYAPPECRDFVPPSCTTDGECTGLGADWRCCANEVGDRLCFEVEGGQCPIIGDRCQDDAECGQGEVCCGPVGGRACVPTLSCADTCATNADCPGVGVVCCPDSMQCTPQIDCTTDGVCGSDGECPDGICCRAFKYPTCIGVSNCPDPCSSEDDCPGTQMCCGSQASAYGAHCRVPLECRDVADRDCTRDADCNGGQVCCRSLDVPACMDSVDCPRVCAGDGDCPMGTECCGADVRTPVCVPEGTCLKEEGERCGGPTECESGLSCCPYDGLGTVCVPDAFCGQQIPRGLDCMANPGACNAYPLAICCRVDGVAQCTTLEACDAPPHLLCRNDDDCGPAGFDCCEPAVDARCLDSESPSCGGSNNCQSDQDCPGGFVCCDTGSSGMLCVPPDQCALPGYRVTCATETDCTNGQVCCSIGSATVCEVEICGEFPFCCQTTVPVCAAASECQ